MGVKKKRVNTKQEESNISCTPISRDEEATETENDKVQEFWTAAKLGILG